MRQLFGKTAGWFIAAAVSAVPVTAFARSHGDVQVDVRVPVGVDDNCPPTPVRHETRVWVEPIYRTVNDRQWVEPVYQTVTDRVWVPEGTRQESVRVWVPDRFEFRDVVSWNWGHRVIHRERVLVQPGHYEDQPGQVCVVPAHYEDVARQQLVCEGHWQNVQRQELIREGHWEYHEDFIPAPRPRPEWGFELHLPIH